MCCPVDFKMVCNNLYCDRNISMFVFWFSVCSTKQLCELVPQNTLVKQPYFFIKKVALMRRDSNLLRRHYPDQLKGRNDGFLSANKLPCSRFVLTLYFNLIYFAIFFIFTYLLLWLSQEQTSFLFQVENNAVLYHSIIKIFSAVLSFHFPKKSYQISFLYWIVPNYRIE